MDNRTFWNDRYLSLPQLGSGPGSRAYAAWLKRNLIEAIIARDGVRSILDIGCGDMYWMPLGIAGVDYTGVDISDVIVANNRARFPDSEFLLHDIAAAPLARTADLVVCFDVLIHQLDRERFDAALRNVLAAISRRGLVSYLTPGDAASVADAAPAAVQREEQALLQFLDSAQFARAQTAAHGELPQVVGTMLPNAAVRSIAAYPRQTIYEIVPG